MRRHGNSAHLNTKKLSDLQSLEDTESGFPAKKAYRQESGEAAIQRVASHIRKHIEYESKHGPVKVLWKDGKPVS